MMYHDVSLRTMTLKMRSTVLQCAFDGHVGVISVIINLGTTNVNSGLHCGDKTHFQNTKGYFTTSKSVCLWILLVWHDLQNTLLGFFENDAVDDLFCSVDVFRLSLLLMDK